MSASAKVCCRRRSSASRPSLASATSYRSDRSRCTIPRSSASSSTARTLGRALRGRAGVRRAGVQIHIAGGRTVAAYNQGAAGERPAVVVRDIGAAKGREQNLARAIAPGPSGLTRGMWQSPLAPSGTPTMRAATTAEHRNAPQSRRGPGQTARRHRGGRAALR
jgi:hypothetical protein